MRIAFTLPLAALLLTTPALAHDGAPEARIAEKMADPVLQDRIAGAMAGVMGAVLDLRVGEIERAIDPGAPVSRDETLRDRAMRDDPYFEDRMVDRTRAMTRGMGAMAGRLAVMMPELRAIGRRVARDLEGVARGIPVSHDDDAGPDNDPDADWGGWDD